MNFIEQNELLLPDSVNYGSVLPVARTYLAALTLITIESTPKKTKN